MMKVVLGLGCDRNTSLQTLQTAINLALQSVSLNLANVGALASIDKKSDEAAILEFSKLHLLPVHFFSAEQLAQVPVPNPSAVVLKYMGTPSVSEASALLAANAEMSQLLVEKYKYCGEDGKNATVSIVKMSESK